ncbi:hypothetical protein H8B09_22525 [Paenibacillus sp. PR3]|uniref:Uncharacterized protein n=1 Tax=Paenibacillus terricola TaxID=2763503 RepID=A0ABR8N2R0_9BACL|nr:hypothetical protein [Paenibacillus terricola]MBD3921561.1 hypothetical protein [Paenibacillus terricola]
MATESRAAKGSAASPSTTVVWGDGRAKFPAPRRRGAGRAASERSGGIVLEKRQRSPLSTDCYRLAISQVQGNPGTTAIGRMIRRAAASAAQRNSCEAAPHFV